MNKGQVVKSLNARSWDDVIDNSYSYLSAKEVSWDPNDYFGDAYNYARRGVVMTENKHMTWGNEAYICTRVMPTNELNNVIPYAQQDSRWRYERLGTVNQTLGGYGCAVVCACMVYTQVNKLITPKIFNERLTSQGGYNIIYGSEAHLAWDRLPQVYSAFRWLGRKSWKRLLDDGELADVLAMIEETPLILWVDFKPSTSKMDTHFVLAVDHSSDDIEIIDPWEGVRSGLLERYGRDTGASLKRAIWGYRRLVVE